MVRTDRLSEHSRLVTLILALCLGCLGVHRIFTGHRYSGLLQFLFSVFSILSIFFIYILNSHLFSTSRIVLVSLRYYVTILGIMGAFFMPFLLVVLWVVWDIILVLCNRFIDADGHRVKLWRIKKFF